MKDFLDKSDAIGGDVKGIADIAKAAFDAQRAFLVMASASKKPSDSALPALIKGMSEQLMAASAFKDANFKSKQNNHITGVADGLGALGKCDQCSDAVFSVAVVSFVVQTCAH